MAGFLVTLITLFFVIRGAKVVERYDKKGYFKIFVWQEFITIISLFMTFGAAIILLAFPFFFHLVLALIALTVIQIILLCFIIHNLMSRASGSKEVSPKPSPPVTDLPE
jgi:hypothetical protein